MFWMYAGFVALPATRPGGDLHVMGHGMTH